MRELLAGTKRRDGSVRLMKTLTSEALPLVVKRIERQIPHGLARSFVNIVGGVIGRVMSRLPHPGIVQIISILRVEAGQTVGVTQHYVNLK